MIHICPPDIPIYTGQSLYSPLVVQFLKFSFGRILKPRQIYCPVLYFYNLKITYYIISIYLIQLPPNNLTPRSPPPPQKQFPLDFLHNFIVILPSEKRALDNSNLLLT